ncbi:MAG TPA: polyphosphate kinase 2 family protein [Actinomycetota bacterium]|nr:polyphosphate kinase 2 family protein [Actinomycetota bacterium]
MPSVASLPTSLRDALRAGADLELAAVDTRSTPGIGGKAEAAAARGGIAERLDELQERLFAEGTRSLLLILQGMDTSGKGGTIRHVVTALNPAWVDVAAFKKPTDEELAHHFLWRIERRLPGPGGVTVFDRSHYEDVLVVRVHGLVPPEALPTRYDEIDAFERRLTEAGTTVVKCMLHISRSEQKERLLARLDDPTKHWKFREGDIDERARWDAYQEAYADAIRRCSTDVAPWYVVPADRKWYRNWAIAQLLLETLEDMDPRYPPSTLDVPRLRKRLADER